ncbi:sigma-70 family RNA polymerase sigma factor [Rhodococcus sp. JVH1]|uniref:sigma-70 family RNA polymerase sigma factor n=1 Tax=Rhodococcus sp. JVH1 TaxID=745408 RepID=UPI000271EEBE|nr:sigma-70 family RNA polymerase sigma factor [Rhodococcus sp. JVH1]EJJ01737.1 RNA polymerase sigma factor, sigma-70 family protein [Rhodococcus sp. JVH1]
MDAKLDTQTQTPIQDTSEGADVYTGDGGREISDLDQAASAFLNLRPRLFGIAYRILGSASEAEDIVQEVWLRWQGTDRTVVINPSAFLATTTTRLAITLAQSARKRHETYDLPSLPEPVDPHNDPAAEAELCEEVQSAMLILQELTPTERAAYVLREAFDYPYRKISEILHLGVANTRQLVKRARNRIAARREHRGVMNVVAHRRLVRAFFSAAQAGNFADLEELLAKDVVDPSRPGIESRKPISSMTDREFWRHVQQDTDDELQADIDNPARTPEQHDALVHALLARKDAHDAAERLADNRERWPWVRPNYFDTDSDFATAAVV